MQLSNVVLSNPKTVWQDKNAKSISYFCKRKPVSVGKALINELKEISINSGNQNVRLCLHKSPNSPFHDMIILEHKGEYYRPHKHLTKGESFHIIEGSMAIFIFDEKGNIIDTCLLNTANNLIYRLDINMFHAIMPLSDLVIYHESKLGPFLSKGDSIYSSWAPVGDNPKETAKYQDRLLDIFKVSSPKIAKRKLSSYKKM